MISLHDGEKKFENTCNRFDRLPACDGQTDRRTDILRRHSPRYAYASRGKNAAGQESDSCRQRQQVSRLVDLYLSGQNWVGGWVQAHSRGLGCIILLI